MMPAVPCWLGLRQRWHESLDGLGHSYGMDVATRLGLQTGLVRVGVMGDNLPMDSTHVLW